MDSWIKFVLFSSLWFAAGAEFDGRSARQMASSNGLCRYGTRVDCCWGWTRQSWGHCQPLCQPACKHGDCVGPNKCKCHAGFTGKTCNQAKEPISDPGPLHESHRVEPSLFSSHQDPEKELTQC